MDSGTVELIWVEGFCFLVKLRLNQWKQKCLSVSFLFTATVNSSDWAHVCSCYMEEDTFIYFFITTVEAMVLGYKWTIFLFTVCISAVQWTTKIYLLKVTSIYKLYIFSLCGVYWNCIFKDLYGLFCSLCHFFLMVGREKRCQQVVLYVQQLVLCCVCGSCVSAPRVGWCWHTCLHFEFTGLLVFSHTRSLKSLFTNLKVCVQTEHEADA